MGNLVQFGTQLLDKIPATFWGVVAGSLFTLIGVYFTNRASEHRLRLQLENDAKLNNREREMAFRKDTYSAAAEAIAVSMTALTKFSDLDFSMKEISNTYLEKSPVIAKVNLVAGEDTIRALATFGTEFAGAFARLCQPRMALSILQNQIAAKVAQIEGFARTRDAMLELMQRHTIDGIQNDRRFETLRENFDFECIRVTTANGELKHMNAELITKHIPFAQQCFAESKRVNQTLVPLLVAARTELELSINAERYTEIISQMYPKADKDIGEFIQKIADTYAVETAPQTLLVAQDAGEDGVYVG